jgi:antagonist of KipI
VNLLRIERPGMLTTVQDGGRWGFQHWGVSVSGPMDAWSARLANRLVRNRDETPLLEVTLVGPRFQIGRDSTLAVTGATFDVEIGSAVVRTPFVVRVPTGATVAFGQRLSGARAYVAVDGGLQVPLVLGSGSAQLRSGFGGMAGRALKTGDEVPLGAARHGQLASAVDISTSGPAPGEDGSCRLRVIRRSGDDTAGHAFDALCAAEFTVATESDRMGYRLKGHVSWPEIPGDLLSTPTTVGAVQLPPGGEPILLMADRQTTGGYLQLAVLARADRQVAGQLAPGDRLRFDEVTLDAASAAHRERESALDAIAPRVVE